MRMHCIVFKPPPAARSKSRSLAHEVIMSRVYGSINGVCILGDEGQSQRKDLAMDRDEATVARVSVICSVL